MRRLLLVLALAACGCGSCGPDPSGGPDSALPDASDVNQPPSGDGGQDGAADDSGNDEPDVTAPDVGSVDEGGFDGPMPDAGMGCAAPLSAPTCAVDADCATGTCRDGWCLLPFDDCSTNRSPYATTCVPSSGGAATLAYDVSDSARSYVVTPFVRTGSLTPRLIQLPSGAAIDLQTTNGWQSITANSEGWINPTLIPATDSHLAHLETGTHHYVVDTDADEVCWQLVEEVTTGARLELVVHLVGLDGIDAANAASHADFSAMLNHAFAILLTAGLDAEVVEFRDANPDDATRWSVIRSDWDARQLTSRADAGDAPSEDDVLRLHVFFTRSFAHGSLGTSPGLPGAPGLLRTRASGIVLTSQLLGTMPMGSFDPRVQDGNLVTGTAMAHEIGHFLGLMHTSEFAGAINDPLSDTPECTPPLDTNCPDIDNFMFPAAADNHEAVSAQQGWVVGAHPLTK